MAKGLYEIENVNQRTFFGRGGQATEVFEVNVITKSGVTFSENFNKEDYTPENVKSVLTKEAENHEKIMAL